MFVDVTKTFLKFSITFILFVVAFALGFYTLLQDKFGLVHDNIGRSIVKTLVMMIGEFDFDDLFNSPDQDVPDVAWFIFIVFLIITFICITIIMYVSIFLNLKNCMLLRKLSEHFFGHVVQYVFNIHSLRFECYYFVCYIRVIC